MRLITPVAAGGCLALTLSLASCAAGAQGPIPSASASATASASAQVSTASGTPVVATQAQLKAITDDLATRGVVGEVKVVSASSLTWNDGSLGCPQAGRMYPQVLTPGFRVVVSVAGKAYDYRFGAGTPQLCG
jgi:hypothetical protein